MVIVKSGKYPMVWNTDMIEFKEDIYGTKIVGYIYIAENTYFDSIRKVSMKEHYLNEYDTVIVDGVKIWGKDEH